MRRTSPYIACADWAAADTHAMKYKVYWCVLGGVVDRGCGDDKRFSMVMNGQA